MQDFVGNVLKLGDNVSVVKKNRLIEAQVIDFTAKKIRVAFDVVKYSWAVGYSFKYGAFKGQTPTMLVNPDQIVKTLVDLPENSDTL